MNLEKALDSAGLVVRAVAEILEHAAARQPARRRPRGPALGGRLDARPHRLPRPRPHRRPGARRRDLPQRRAASPASVATVPRRAAAAPPSDRADRAATRPWRGRRDARGAAPRARRRRVRRRDPPAQRRDPVLRRGARQYRLLRPADRSAQRPDHPLRVADGAGAGGRTPARGRRQPGRTRADRRRDRSSTPPSSPPGCARRSTPSCSSSTAPPTASATRCCARPSSRTSSPARRPPSTSASPRRSKVVRTSCPPRRSPSSWPTIGSPHATCARRSRWSLTAARATARSTRASRCACTNGRSSCGTRSRVPRRSPVPTPSCSKPLPTWRPMPAS